MRFFVKKFFPKLEKTWLEEDPQKVFVGIMMLSAELSLGWLLISFVLYIIPVTAFSFLSKASFLVGMIGLPSSVMFGLVGAMLCVVKKERHSQGKITVEDLHEAASRVLLEPRKEEVPRYLEEGYEINQWFRIARIDGDTAYVLREGDLGLCIVKSPHLTEHFESRELEVGEWAELELRQMWDVETCHKLDHYHLISVGEVDSSFPFPSLLLGDEYASTFVSPEDEEDYELAKELVSYRDDFIFVVPATPFYGYESSPSLGLQAFVISGVEEGDKVEVLVYAHSEREAYLIAYFDENIAYEVKCKIKEDPAIERREELDELSKSRGRRSWGFVEHDKSVLHKAFIAGGEEHACSDCHAIFPRELAEENGHFVCSDCGGIQCLLTLAFNFCGYASDSSIYQGDICCSERAKYSLEKIGQKKISILHDKLEALFEKTVLRGSLFYPELRGLHLEKEGLLYEGKIFINHLGSTFPITLRINNKSVLIFHDECWAVFDERWVLQSLARFQAKKIKRLEQ